MTDNTEETTEPENNIVVILETAQPTTKQQLITAAIGVGTLIAVPVVIAGTMAVAGGVAAAASKVKSKFSRNPAVPDVVIVVEDPDTDE